MSDTGRDSNLVPDDVQDNYAQVRADRGWSWEQMSEQFTKDGQRTLAAWARQQAAVEQATSPRGRRRVPRGSTVAPALPEDGLPSGPEHAAVPAGVGAGGGQAGAEVT